MTKNFLTNVLSKLYTAEAAESKNQSRADMDVADPSPEEASLAIGKNTVESKDSKPHDCTCAYPHVRTRNVCGHPEECRYYARWARETGVVE